jgi:predicted nucleic-acid-binding Zn-ribbon protein
MKASFQCPKCAGKKAFRVREIRQTYCDAQGTLRSFDLTGAEIATGEKGLLGGDKTKLELVGPMAAVVCAGCGYTEWYAAPAALAKLARMVGRSDGLVTVTDDT